MIVYDSLTYADPAWVTSLAASKLAGQVAATTGGTGLDTSGNTGVAQVAAGTWSVTTTLQNAVQDNITRLGTVTTGSFPAANLTGTTLAATVVTSSLTTVGALGAGSITSGFGAIDIGTDAFTGGNANLSGILTVTGFGTHTINSAGTPGNTLQVTNSTAGTGNFARISLGNDNGQRGFITVLSSTFTSSTFNVADGLAIIATGTGGSSFGSSNAAGTTRLYALNNKQVSLGEVTTHNIGGAGSGFNILQSTNTTAGTLNGSAISCVTDAGVNRFRMAAFSTTWTPDAVNYADGCTFVSVGVGGISFAATDSGANGNVRILARGSAASNLVATFGANRNQLIGAATAPGSGTDAIVFPAGTALATMATDTAGLQGSAVSGIVNLFSINESNEVGRLTPGGVSLPRDFAPGSFTVQANRFVRFPSYLSLGAGETATLESGAELRID